MSKINNSNYSNGHSACYLPEQIYADGFFTSSKYGPVKNQAIFFANPSHKS